MARFQVLIMAATFGVTMIASAGEYVKRTVDPNTGQFFKNPLGGTFHWWENNSSAYGTSSEAYGGGAYSAYFVECEGTITTVYDWVRDTIPDPSNPTQQIPDPLDNPPEEVISAEYCTAYFDVTGVNVLGDCDNGLGFEPVYDGEGGHIWGSSTGTLYTNRAGGDSIALTCTPSSYGWTDAGIVSAWVSYKSAIIVPKVTLLGVTRFNTPPAVQFLTGQRVTCSIELPTPPGFPDLTIRQYIWNLEGSIDEFRDFQHSYASDTSDGIKVPINSQHRRSPQFYFYSVRGGNTLAKCDLSLRLPAGAAWAQGTTGNFQAKSLSFESVRPVLTKWEVKSGIVALLADKFNFHEDVANGVPWGQDWSEVTISVPNQFGQVGEATFCQIITAKREVKRSNSGIYPSTFKNKWYGLESLDAAFPVPSQYGGVWNLPNQGTGHDSPFQYLGVAGLNDGGGNNWYSAKSDDSFKTWVMYRPPSVNGQPRVWIPISKYTWKWNGEAELTSGTWSLKPGYSGGPTSGVAEAFDHPGWLQVTFFGVPMVGVP